MKIHAPHPWKVLHQQLVYHASPWIRVALQHVRLPDGKEVNDFHRVEMSDYAVIVAWTVEGKLIFERQYKHGIGRVSLTLPGGLLAQSEKPLATARRELLEETGYRARHWQKLGSFVCNSNYGCGRAHFFTACDAYRIAQPNSGDLEDMELVLLSLPQALAALRRGQIHSVSTATGLLLAQHALR